MPGLDDILANIDFIRRSTAGITIDAFRDDLTKRLAVERCLEIISEASRHVPESARARHPEIPWEKVKAIGNVLRHAYQRVDYDIIWETAIRDLDPLQRAIEGIKSLELRGPQSHATRIDRRFAALKQEGRAALVTFITAGDPDLATSRAILAGLPAAGADVIELGMPFSDPMADGPAIQASSLRALRAGHKMRMTLDMVAEFRTRDQDTPIVLMGYYNPIYVYPGERFLDDAVAAGVDGLIVVDVPPEADEELCLPALERGLNFIRLATPTTDAKRLPKVLANTSGFVYYVSITGITGSAAPDVNAVHTEVARLKTATSLPVAVGFGVKTSAQARAIAKGADGVVVGSALVTAIQQSLGPKGEPTGQTVPAVLELVKSLGNSLRAGAGNA